MHMFIYQFFKQNTMEAFSNSMMQVDILNKIKRVHIMQVIKQFILHNAQIPIFRAESNESIFKFQPEDPHEVGGYIEQEQEGVHHVHDTTIGLKMVEIWPFHENPRWLPKSKMATKIQDGHQCFKIDSIGASGILSLSLKFGINLT